MALGPAYGGSGGAGEPSFEITDEVDTGQKWVDGKAIYRQAATGTCQAAPSRITVDTSLWGIDEPVRYWGRVKRGEISTEDQFVTIPGTEHPSVVADQLLCTFRASEFFAIGANTQFDNEPYIVFLYYTKA